MTKDNNHLGQFNLDGIPPAPRGVPQIEVTFEIDENNNLNVTAVEKGKGISQKITITNDKGRFSKEQIEDMIKEAEKNSKEDEQIVKKVQAKNTLESTAYNLKNQMNDENLKDKFEEDDKKKLEESVTSTIQWLEGNQNAEAEEYEAK